MAKTGNLEMIKKVNRSLVLRLIREDEPITRAQIAQKLHLSRSTVSLIVDELIHKKFVKELGLSSSTSEGGRRGMKLGFNTKSAYGIGVDIGGSKTLILISDLDGNVVFKETHPIPKQFSVLIELIQTCIERSPLESSEIIGMGVSLPGTIDIENGILMNDAPALGYKNVNLRQELQPHFTFPLFFNNDVNCTALGEKWLGSGGNASHIVFIAIGTGLGSAIIANGELITGHRYAAGEIGYFVTPEEVRNNIVNDAEKFGLLENKISGTALAQSGYSPEELFQLSLSGDQRASAIVDEFIIHLSTAISNIVSLMNPEKVIIGGEISELLGPFLDLIKKKVANSTPIETKIELALLGGNAGAIGAITYAFEQIQENE
ncbi:ROK family transcriptional regulator [Paenibacillus planticolens]|uniref:ROK family protein n=1 Tax=Paenibacillus planticolens TaxID=2654976 RepID=A0ABX1ZF21_9BACL|nr:ROK family transcriptional regulator [Paenibacillus planticolens]NOU98695.1 ROK family protein [Paenibacillus planticolens]